MNNIHISTKNIYIVLLNMVKFLNEKNELLRDEALHIQRSVNFAKSKSPHLESQFDVECQVITDGLSNLLGKLSSYKEDVKKEIKEVSYLINDGVLSNTYLEKILLFDCMRERGYSFADKLEYFYRAYENLVGSHRYLYIPTPSISRRVKTSNLMLYFNKEIKEEYQYLQKNFFNIKESEIEDNIISTWSFSPVEHLKTFDDTPNHYISFSFWFYEKQYFYPIAFHEVAHALFMKRNKSDSDDNDFKLGEEKARKISNQLFLSRDTKTFHLSMVHTIFQDIIADLSAYVVSGESYIHALFYTGFMRGINKNFYKDIEEESLFNEVAIDDKERQCKVRHKKMTLLTWTNIDNDFISFFVRLKILIRLHQTIETSISDELDGIENILNVIYPTKNFADTIGTFESILMQTKSNSQAYTHEKSFVLLATNLLSNEIFSRKKLLNKIETLYDDRKKQFLSKDLILFLEQQEILDIPRHEDKSEIINIVTKHKNNLSSYYDLVWKIRFELIQKDRSTPSGRIMRLNNLYKLKIFPEIFSPENLDKVIYELIFFKYNDKLNPLEKFKEMSYTDELCCYTFGAYDTALLTEKTTSQVDLELKNRDSDHNFFTERHALYKLKTYENSDQAKDTNNRYWNLIVAISMKKDFLDKNSTEGRKNFKQLIDSIEENSTYYLHADFFISMGNENFLVYFHGVKEEDIKIISSNFYNLWEIYQNIYTTVLLNNQSIKNTNHFHEISFSKNSIVLFCKLHKLFSIQKITDVELDIKNQCKEIGSLYRLYGVYDYKIVINENIDTINKISDFINNTKDIFVDVQIEYQHEI